jgi:hypothetical protein
MIVFVAVLGCQLCYCQKNLLAEHLPKKPTSCLAFQLLLKTDTVDQPSAYSKTSNTSNYHQTPLKPQISKLQSLRHRLKPKPCNAPTTPPKIPQTEYRAFHISDRLIPRASKTLQTCFPYTEKCLFPSQKVISNLSPGTLSYISIFRNKAFPKKNSFRNLKLFVYKVHFININQGRVESLLALI